MGASQLAVVRAEQSAVAIYDAAAHAAYLEEKRDIIRAMCLPEQFRRDNALLDLVIEIGKLRGLNPIAKQMWVVPRGGKPSIETSIDGYRLIASRTGLYAGSDEPLYDVEDAEHPGRSTVTVYRIVHGERFPFTATVRWSEFGVTGWTAKYDNLWKTKPYHMLGIRAESHALKKAFPEETSGLSVDDDTIDLPFVDEAREIRTGPPPAPPVPRPQAGGSSRRQMREMASRMDAQEAPIKAKVTPAPTTEIDPHAPGEWEGPASDDTITEFWKQMRAAKITPEGVWAAMQRLYSHAYAAAMEKHGKPTLDFMTTEDVHDLMVALMSNPEPDDAPMFTDEELAETARKSEAARQRALTGN